MARGGSGDDEGSPRERQDRAGWRAPSGESQTCREAGVGDSDSQGQKQAGESGHVFLSRPSRCEDRALPAGKGAADAPLVPAGNPFGPALTERGARRRDSCCFLRLSWVSLFAPQDGAGKVTYGVSEGGHKWLMGDSLAASS